MKNVIGLIAVLVAASVSSAANISEFHEHAAKGQTEITPHFMYDMMTLEANTGGQKIKITGFKLGSEFEKGVCENASVGFDVTYGSHASKSDFTTNTLHTSGINDLVLFARGSSAMGEGRLAYGANVNVSNGASVSKVNGDMNEKTGGNGISPYVGYETKVGSGIWGADLGYTWLGQRVSLNESGHTYTSTSGGNTLSIGTFYE